MILQSPTPVVADIVSVDLDNEVVLISISVCDSQISGFADIETIRKMQRYGLSDPEEKRSFRSVVEAHCKFTGLYDSDHLEVFADQVTAKKRIEELEEKKDFASIMTSLLLAQLTDRLPESVDYAV